MQIITVVNKYLSLEEENLDKKGVIILCILAYLFGVICRSFYIFNAFTDTPYVLLDGLPMINTEDGYFFAEYVKTLADDSLNKNYNVLIRGGGHGSVVLLTWLLHEITPFTIEQVAVCIPVIFAPLVALPFIFIGRLLGNSLFGFTAGILTSISPSFFRRTSFAYFDSDIFSLTAPTLLVCLGIYTLLNPSLRSILIIGVIAVLSGWMDKPLVNMPIYLTFFTIFIIMHFRNEDFFKMLILLSVPLLSEIVSYHHIIICFIVYGLLRISQNYSIPIIDDKTEKRMWAVIAILFCAYTLIEQPLFASIQGYITSYSSEGRGILSPGSTSWSFYKVTGTIVEARTIDINGLAKATSSYFSLFLLGLLGACLALIRFPLLILGSSLLGIGFFSLYGGIRFSMYLAPILSIGIAYLIMLAQRYIYIFIKIRYLNWGVALILLAIVLYPNILLAYNHQPRAVARIPQVSMLRNIDKVSDRNDYIISWWDYGYVMRYYSSMRTLIDGGKHQNDNYVVSKAFSSTSQPLAANLIREAVEAYESGGRSQVATEHLFGRRRKDFQPNQLINQMARTDYVLQREETRDIYLYIPYQMLRIYGVVRQFSDLNIVTGKLERVPFFNTQNYRIDRNNNRILLPGNMIVDLKKGNILRSQEIIGKINTVYHHQVRNNKVEMRSQRLNSFGNFSVLLSNYYHIVYVGGPQVMNSNFIQMFFFKNYDKNYFELIDENSLAVLYKLKRRNSSHQEQSQAQP